MCLCARFLMLTISFALLARVAVVKDAFRIMSPGQAAELDPLQYIIQRGEVICLHETNCYPV